MFKWAETLGLNYVISPIRGSSSLLNSHQMKYVEFFLTFFTLKLISIVQKFKELWV